MTRYLISILFLLLPLFTHAQLPTDIIVLHRIAQEGKALVLDLTVDLTHVSLSKCHSLVFTPVVTKGDSATAFPAIVVNGKERQKLYRRLKRPATEQAYTIEHAHKGLIAYQGSVPCQPWMAGAQIIMVTDSCGCGWGDLAKSATPKLLGTWNEVPQLPEVNALAVIYPLCYIEPAATVKTYKLEGRAYLDFPVNRTEIHLSYRNNPRELAKIVETIDVVKKEVNATITHIDIHGYASPEGSYANNVRLANGRAAALRDYVSQLMSLPANIFSVEATPEDWEGLQRYVKDSAGIDHRQEILQLIQAEADQDKREAKIRKAFPATYKYMLQNWYPALRHSDYTVNYTIRPFTVEEAKAVYQKHPEQLSPNELYLVALTYGEQSAERKEVMQTAARLYPDSPAANLNAANLALEANQLAEAKALLYNAGDLPASQYARGVLAAKLGDFTTARRLFEVAAQKGISEATEALHILSQLKK